MTILAIFLALGSLIIESTPWNIEWWAEISWPMNGDSLHSFHGSSTAKISQHRLHCSSFDIEITETVIHFSVTIFIDHHITG